MEKIVEWLKEFAKTREDFVGYAICVGSKMQIIPSFLYPYSF